MACNNRIVTVAVLAATTIACASLPALASADPGGTLYVSHGGTPGAQDKGCSTAAHSTVQSAVDAAHAGQTVYLCGTTPYQESVVVAKDLKLTGDPGAAIQAS